ncbi:hypothetical protein BDZ97DRAFT_1823569 [Flammula alnicola]|nr:hypothetical protein BDZ97DRAFT_1823569 [Flammula alnicola]
MVNNLMPPPNSMMANPDMQQQIRPPISHQPSNAGPSQQQQNLNASLRPPPVPLQPPPVKRGQKVAQGGGVVSTPSPAPMQVSTPAATPTAVASSPPASTKSPKTRAPPKPKAPAPRTRRVSKAVPPVVPPAASEPAQPTASTSTVSVKRQREDDSLFGDSMGTPSGSGVANEPSPPKRAKTEWESPPSEELRKKEEAHENIKTEEDASHFFEQMTELIKMAAEGEGQESLTSDISETLDMILKGYGSVPNSTDGAGNVSMGESSTAREPTPQPDSMMDSFDQFFDFSFGTVEDEDSKAPTPDLVSSSSTNPSPESNHEADASHHTLPSASSSTDIKSEEPSDPLRLGPWKDIDGGEAAYYQTNEWKWDSPMPSLDQPWAIYNP